MHIHIINGPNLNLLGKREPDIYGKETFDGFLERLKDQFSTWNLTYFQSNVEGEIINSLHEYGFKADGIVLNAGGFTHTSVAIGDAVAAITSPVIEVHISNVYARESFRHQSYIAPQAKGIIAGFGLDSYRLALHFFDLQKL
jgi:3-dehydroquinate dehydratase-2